MTAFRPVFSAPIVIVLLGAACVQQEPASNAQAPGPPPPATYGAPAAAPAPAPSPAAATTAPPAASASASPTPASTPAPAASGKTPTATASIGAPSISGEVANAETQANAMQPDFTRCYAEGLIADPRARGSLLVALQLGKDGAVTRADVSPSGHVPQNVQTCIRDRARSAKFSAPKGGSAIVSFTVTLSQAPATETTTATASAGSGKLEEVAVSPPGFEHGEKVALFVRAKARECYRDALRIDAKAEGQVSVALWLDDAGKVTKVEALRTGTLPDTVTKCIQKRSKPAYFPKPKIAPTVVTVPIRLALKPAKPST
jgi:hypothetical protein